MTQVFYKKDGTDYVIEYLLSELNKDGFKRGFRIKGEMRFVNLSESLVDTLIDIFDNKDSVTFGKSLLIKYNLITKEEKYWGVLITILSKNGYVKLEEKKGVDKVSKTEFSYKIATPGDKILAVLFAIKWRRNHMRNRELVA